MNEFSLTAMPAAGLPNIAYGSRNEISRSCFGAATGLQARLRNDRAGHRASRSAPQAPRLAAPIAPASQPATA